MDGPDVRVLRRVRAGEGDMDLIQKETSDGMNGGSPVNPTRIRPRVDPSRVDRSADSIIRAVAADQHGVVARRQLLKAGVTRHVIENRVATGWLQPLHRGVYKVGPLTVPLEREMAAVLACGEMARLSHASAAVCHGLVPKPKPDEKVAISVSVGYGPRIRGPGILVHRVGRMEPDEITTIEGIPITTAARTILDLAAIVDPRALEQAVSRALRSGLAAEDAMARLLDRYPRRAGTPALRAILTRGESPAFVRSEAEARLLALVRSARLPIPRVNDVVRGVEVDFFWPSYRLIVEVDGFAYHGSRAAFERDRRRDMALADVGLRVMRVTWRQLTEESEALLVSLARALTPVSS